MDMPNRDEAATIYTELFSGMREGIAVYEPIGGGEDFRIVDMNPRALALSRLDREQVIGRPVTEVFPAVGEIGLLDLFREVSRTGESRRLGSTRYHDGRVEQWVENYLFRTPSGKVVAVYEDSSEKERAVAELEKSEEQLRLISENTTDGLLVFERGEPQYVSPAYKRMIGYNGDEELPREAVELSRLLHPEDRERVLDQFAEAVAEQSPSLMYTYRGRLKSGEYRWREDNVRLIYDDRRRHLRTYVVARDVHERVEQAIALEAKHVEVQALLNEKELLLREVHHRMKNDMNLVRSLLSIQASRAGNAAGSEELLQAVRRVGILSQVYDRLHDGSDIRRIALCPFIEEIGADLRSGGPQPGMEVTVRCSEIEVPTRLSVSLGIIVNELVTNAAKYAFADVERPRVRITCSPVGSGALELTVEDNGSGYPDEQLKGESYGFGLTLVATLAEQHDGSVKLENRDGARAEVVVQLPA